MREARRTPGSPILFSPPGSGSLEWGGGARPIRTRLPRTPSSLSKAAGGRRWRGRGPPPTLWLPQRGRLHQPALPLLPGEERAGVRRGRFRSFPSIAGREFIHFPQTPGANSVRLAYAPSARRAVARSGLLRSPVPIMAKSLCVAARRGRAVRAWFNHFPQSPGANSVRLAPRYARGAVAPSGLVRSPVPHDPHLVCCRVCGVAEGGRRPSRLSRRIPPDPGNILRPAVSPGTRASGA